MTIYPSSQPNRLDRRLDDDFSRSAKRPSLQSAIVATNQPAANSIKVKQENVVQQDKEPDKKSVVRNRRMFGMIVGTLQKFQSEETQRKVVVSFLFVAAGSKVA